MRRVVALAFVWGWSFLFIKVAGRGMTPATVAGTRIVLGALVIVATCRINGLRLPRDRTSWRHFVVMGVTSCAVPFTLLAWGEQRIGSSVAAVANATTPLFTALYSALVAGERLRRPQLVGLVIGFLGVTVAAGLAGSDLANSSVAGVGSSVAAAAFYGVAFVYARRHLRDIAPLIAAAGQLVAASIIMAPIAVATSVASGFHLTPTRAASIVLLGVIGTGFAYVVNFGNINALGATKASMVTYLVPVVAVAVGVAFLGENFSARLVVGGLITVAGVALVQTRLRGLGRLRTIPLVGTVLAALLLSACSGSTSASPCQTVHDTIDPASAIHLLPGAPEPVYRTNPPTSGPHQLTGIASIPRGVLTTPVPGRIQVALLEKGGVLIQYSGSPSAAASLAPLAAGQPLVALAPGTALPSPVVATAWTWKTVCTSPDPTAIRQFIATHEGHGPGTP